MSFQFHGVQIFLGKRHASKNDNMRQVMNELHDIQCVAYLFVWLYDIHVTSLFCSATNLFV
jgi:hypothetical protein